MSQQEQAAKTEGKKIKVTESFRFSPDGLTVVDYEPGEQEVPANVAAFAIAQKKATAAK